MNNNRDIRRTGAFEIVTSISRYFQFWPNQEGQPWSWLAWRYLDESGLTAFKNEREQLVVFGYVPAAALFYNECLGESGRNDV
jgi:hypothetical protein